MLVALLLGLTLFVSGVCDAIGGNSATVAITDFLFSHLTEHCDQPLGTLVTGKILCSFLIFEGKNQVG